MNKLLQKHGWYSHGLKVRRPRHDWHHPVHGGIITSDAARDEWCHWRKQNVFSSYNQFLAPGSVSGKDAVLMAAKKSLKIYLEQLDNQLKAA